jgi:hypothetical protein
MSWDIYCCSAETIFVQHVEYLSHSIPFNAWSNPFVNPRSAEKREARVLYYIFSKLSRRNALKSVSIGRLQVRLNSPRDIGNSPPPKRDNDPWSIVADSQAGLSKNHNKAYSIPQAKFGISMPTGDISYEFINERFSRSSTRSVNMA